MLFTVGDARNIPLKDKSVQLICFSPPYWALRQYKVKPLIWGGEIGCRHKFSRTNAAPSLANFSGGGPNALCSTLTLKAMSGKSSTFGRWCQLCGAWYGQLGLEPIPELYLDNMMLIMAEVWRVLKDGGVCFVNIGDSSSGSNKAGSNPEYQKRHTEFGKPSKEKQRFGMPTNLKHIKPKSLCLIPQRFAIACQVAGWVVRSEIIWCLSGGTRVYTKTRKGEMSMMIRDMARRNPEIIKLWNGEKWTQLLDISKSKRKGNELEIVLRSGERISCTPIHKWPTEDGIKEASELNIGDIIQCCNLPAPEQPIYPDKLLTIGRFVGLYLAEGSRNSFGRISISSHKKELSRYTYLKEIARSFGGTCGKYNTSENGMVICMKGKILNAILDTYIVGKLAKGKHLSAACWQRGNLFLDEILDGYLEGDGHWDLKNERWRLGFTRNYDLEADLRTICARLEYQVRIKPSKGYINEKGYDIFRGEIRCDPSSHLNIKAQGEIVEIRKARARHFYNIEVADEPHLFALASGVLTCNSKRSHMPESVKDRPTRSHELIWMMTKKGSYYWDQDAVHTGTANIRDVWYIATEQTPEAHFASWPKKLPELMIKAATKPGDIVLDPFCGTGKTVTVAKNLNRMMTGHSFSLDHEYQTQSVEWISNLPVKNITSENCVLFMWAVSPLLPEALKVMESWQFKYKTVAFCWNKITKTGINVSNLGRWTMGNVELCLLGVKGRPKRIRRDIKQLITAVRTIHSRKPIEVKRRIVQLMGDLPRIELFARNESIGWDVWGDEIRISIFSFLKSDPVKLKRIRSPKNVL